MQECPRSLKGQYRIKWSVARIADGAIFGPTVLQLSKLPGADRSSRRRSSLDIHLFVLGFSHAELTVQTSLRDAKEMIRWLVRHHDVDDRPLHVTIRACTGSDPWEACVRPAPREPIGTGTLTSQVAPGRSQPGAATLRELGDRELIAGARQGHAHAVEILYRRYSQEALGFARGMVRAGQDAEDLVQEAFTKTMRALANGNGPHENFQAYFYTALKSVATQSWSRNRRELPVEAGFLEATQGAVGDDRLDRVLDAGTNARVLVALQSLPERWQRALWYADVLQEPPRRIAPLMGIKPNAVSALVRRARTGLRAAYLDAAIGLALDESSS